MFHTHCTSYDQFLANSVYGGLGGEWIFLFLEKNMSNWIYNPWPCPSKLPQKYAVKYYKKLLIKFGRTLFSELPGWDMRALPWVFSLFRIHKKIPTQTNQLAKFSYPKKSGNNKFQTPNNSPITPITRNLEYPQEVVPSLFFKTRQSTKPLKWE